MSLEQDLERGDRAEKLLKDETLTNAFKAVHQAIHDKIDQTPIRDAEGLTQLRLMLKLLSDVRANLEQAVRGGKLAAADLKIKRERMKVRFFR